MNRQIIATTTTRECVAIMNGVRCGAYSGKDAMWSFLKLRWKGIKGLETVCLFGCFACFKCTVVSPLEKFNPLVDVLFPESLGFSFGDPVKNHLGTCFFCEMLTACSDSVDRFHSYKCGSFCESIGVGCADFHATSRGYIFGVPLPGWLWRDFSF